MLVKFPSKIFGRSAVNHTFAIFVALFLSEFVIRLVAVYSDLTVAILALFGQLTFYGGMFLLFAGFATDRRCMRNLVVVLCAYTLSLVLLVLSFAYYSYFKISGTFLELEFVVRFLKSPSEWSPLIMAEARRNADIKHLHTLLVCMLCFSLFMGKWLSVKGFDMSVSPKSSGVLAVLLLSATLGGSLYGVLSPLSSSPLPSLLSGYIFREEIKKLEHGWDAPKDASLIPTDSFNQKNIVFFILESTRAQSTTPYSPNMATTPYMNELAKTSIVAERARPMVLNTSKSVFASICGLYPQFAFDVSEIHATPAPCLPSLLRSLGYRSVFFQTPTQKYESREKLVHTMGFRDFVSGDQVALQSQDPTLEEMGFEKINYFGYEDDIMLAPSESWLRDNKLYPFVAAYLTNVTHHPYAIPSDFTTTNLGTELGITRGLEESYHRYLLALNYQDRFVHQIIEQYKKLGIYDKTIFVFVGDTGQGFAEHGRQLSVSVIYEEGLWIPLIVHAPGLIDSRSSIRQNVMQIDIVPTIFDLLGVEVVGGEYPGVSLLREVKNRVLYSSCMYRAGCISRIDGSQKFIYHYQNMNSELFDLTEDPLEKHNLLEKFSDKRSSYTADIENWRNYVNTAYMSLNQDQVFDRVSSTLAPIDNKFELVVDQQTTIVGFDKKVEHHSNGNYLNVTVVYRLSGTPDAKTRINPFLRDEQGNKLDVHWYAPIFFNYPLEIGDKPLYVKDDIELIAPHSFAIQGSSFILEIIRTDSKGVHQDSRSELFKLESLE